MNGLSQELSFGDFIFECRNEAHLSQQQLADVVGVTRITELRWEHGISMPNITNIRKLAEVLNIPEQRLKPFLETNRRKQQTVLTENLSTGGPLQKIHLA